MHSLNNRRDMQIHSRKVKKNYQKSFSHQLSQKSKARVKLVLGFLIVAMFNGQNQLFG